MDPSLWLTSHLLGGPSSSSTALSRLALVSLFVWPVSSLRLVYQHTASKADRCSPSRKQQMHVLDRYPTLQAHQPPKVNWEECQFGCNGCIWIPLLVLVYFLLCGIHNKIFTTHKIISQTTSPSQRFHKKRFLSFTSAALLLP